MAGRYVDLIQRIRRKAERASGKLNAIGAICCEFGFPWNIVRGFDVMARHRPCRSHDRGIREPIAFEMWQRVEDEASSHIRPA